MLLKWLIRPKPPSEVLFRAPTEPATRRDTVDELIQMDRENVGPAKRAILTAATVGMAASSLGHTNPFGGGDVEITKVWGAADEYVGAVQKEGQQPAAGAEQLKAEEGEEK
jgi:hypothetical protein